MKYAVIRSQGHQYLVSEGDEILVPYTKTPTVETLLVSDGDVKIGTPILTGAKVDFKVSDQMQLGEKISGFKYKSKSRYRKKWGHRAKFVKITINSIKV